MLRHRLAALFEPRSLLVLSDRALPIATTLPDSLRRCAVFVDLPAGLPIVLPAESGETASGNGLDLVVVCAAPSRLPEVLAAIEPRRPRAVVLLPHPTASPDPAADADYCATWARLHGSTVLGPGSFGVQRPRLGLNASLAPKVAKIGGVALVAQSRSIVAAIMDWAEDIDFGFSTVVSVDERTGIDLPAVLDYLATDRHTDGIALYLENTPASRAFTSALHAAAGGKPVVVLKAGHGGAESDPVDDAVFDALLRRTGAVRIRYFVQLFSTLKVLGYTRQPRGRGIALFSNGDAAAQLALDVIGPHGAVFRADLSPASIKNLDSLLEDGARTGNPVVTHAPLDPEKVEHIVRILDADTAVDGVLLLLAPDPLSDMGAVARQLALIGPRARKPIITCLMGDASMRPLRHLLDRVGTPAFRTPESAANAFGILASYYYNQELSLQILPPELLDTPPRLEEARTLLRNARNAQRLELDEAECQRLLDYFNIPIESERHADYPAAAAQAEVPPMAIQVNLDDQIGPYIRFGSGGRDAAASGADRGIELPPLNSYLARQLIERSALWRRALSRRMTPVALAKLQDALERISDLISGLPGIASLVIDPLYADSMHLWAGSVRIRLTSEAVSLLPEKSGYRHMAIHPYPAHLVQGRFFADGVPWMLRPIRPEDAQALQEFIRGLSDESRYMRFVSMLRELTPGMLARYTRIDYDRELALVATVQVPNPEHRGHPREEIIGFAHYLRNADGLGAEFALVIGDRWQRQGLGTHLMGGLIQAAKGQGLSYIEGFVLTNNRAMLSLMARLGFQTDRDSEDPALHRVSLDPGRAQTS